MLKRDSHKTSSMDNRVLTDQLERLQAGEFPKYLYKFSPINSYLFDNLENYQLWCSNPKDFNDPFDCQFNGFKPSHHSHIHVKNGKTELLSELYNKFASKYKVCCFSDLKSEKNKKLLMWSHYADSHKGICMKFNIEKLLRFWIENDPEVSIHKVQYLDKIPKIPVWFDDKDRNKIYFVNKMECKSSEWEYEQEYRVFSYNHTLQIAPMALEEIHFGCASVAEDRHNIVELMQKSGYEKVNFLLAKKSITEFALEFEKL